MIRKIFETEFQIRLKNQDKKIVDYTEKRLLRLSRTMPTKSERDACTALLGMYLEGTVAVKWCNGLPKYVKIPTPNK